VKAHFTVNYVDTAGIDSPQLVGYSRWWCRRVTQRYKIVTPSNAAVLKVTDASEG